LYLAARSCEMCFKRQQPKLRDGDLLFRLPKSTRLHRLNLINVPWGKLLDAQAGRGTFPKWGSSNGSRGIRSRWPRRWFMASPSNRPPRVQSLRKRAKQIRSPSLPASTSALSYRTYRTPPLRALTNFRLSLSTPASTLINDFTARRCSRLGRLLKRSNVDNASYVSHAARCDSPRPPGAYRYYEPGQSRRSYSLLMMRPYKGGSPSESSRMFEHEPHGMEETANL